MNMIDQERMIDLNYEQIQGGYDQMCFIERAKVKAARVHIYYSAAYAAKYAIEKVHEETRELTNATY